MGQDTHIAWANHTVNPWTGCTKVNAGCKNCYMYREKDRWKRKGQESSEADVVKKTKGTGWKTVIRNAKSGERIFVESMGDFWHEKADSWREEVYEEMRKRPDVIYLIPTKRPQNIKERLPEDWGSKGWPNVWIGFSAEQQSSYADFYNAIQEVPCYILWCSMEPMLEEIEADRVVVNGEEVNPLAGSLKYRKLDWIVVGGESGNDTGKHRYRPCEEEWMYKVVQACRRNEVAVFVKQMGTYLSKVMGITRDGKEVREFPMRLRVQEYPEY